MFLIFLENTAKQAININLYGYMSKSPPMGKKVARS